MVSKYAGCVVQPMYRFGGIYSVKLLTPIFKLSVKHCGRITEDALRRSIYRGHKNTILDHVWYEEWYEEWAWNHRLQCVTAAELWLDMSEQTAKKLLLKLTKLKQRRRR